MRIKKNFLTFLAKSSEPPSENFEESGRDVCRVCVHVCSRGELNGVAMWLECRLNAGHVISSGLLSAPTAGQPLRWDPHGRQAVHLLSTPVIVEPGECGQRWTLRYRTVFKPQSGDVDLQFDVVPAAET